MIVELSRRAERDLASIGLWIARDDRDTANRFVAQLEMACAEIGDRPRMYPFLSGSRTIRRRLVERRHLILFRVGRRVVTIVSVRHGARRPLIG